MTGRGADATATARAAAVRVSAPASATNLGPGFDALGLALELRNEAAARATLPGSGRTRIVVEGEGLDELVAEGETPAEGNLLAAALREGLRAGGAAEADVKVRQLNRIPLRRGLGSRAAAAVMGAMAGLELAATFAGRKEGPTAEEVLALALPIAGLPDGLAPAMLGGLCVSWLEKGRVRHLRLDAPRGVAAVLCVPERGLDASAARAALPEVVPFEDAAHAACRAALLVGALATGRGELLAAATEDRLHQPSRIALLPAMGAALEAARKSGALGACLSGSGSTVLAFSKEDDFETQSRVGAAMVRAFSEAAGGAARLLTCRPSPSGALSAREVFGGLRG